MMLNSLQRASRLSSRTALPVRSSSLTPPVCYSHHYAKTSKHSSTTQESGASSSSEASADHSEEAQLASAKRALLKAGFDPASFRVQEIVWGDQDSFQHVNNVRYARFFESARMVWMRSLGHELGGEEGAERMARGQGISLILKSIELQFRRPVTYPDTLLIGFAPLPPASDDDTSFQVKASAYSLAQKKFVTHSKETLTWYDYDNLRKCSPPKAMTDILASRAHAHLGKP